MIIADQRASSRRDPARAAAALSRRCRFGRDRGASGSRFPNCSASRGASRSSLTHRKKFSAGCPNRPCFHHSDGETGRRGALHTRLDVGSTTESTRRYVWLTSKPPSLLSGKHRGSTGGWRRSSRQSRRADSRCENRCHRLRLVHGRRRRCRGFRQPAANRVSAG